MNRMPRLKRMLATSLACATIATQGCGTWLGNPKDPTAPGTPSGGNSDVTLVFQGSLPGAALTTPPLTVLGKAGQTLGTVTLSEARVVLSSITIKSAAEDGKERQKFNGPYIVDLLTQMTRPTPPTIQLDSGAYRSIALELHKIEAQDAAGILSANDPLLNNSIHLVGTYIPAGTSGGPTRSLNMSFELGEKFTMSRNNPLMIEAGSTNALIIGFDLASWFDFRRAEADFGDLPAQSMVLDRNAKEFAEKIRQAIKENIKGSSRIGKDTDKDGKLSTKERDD